MSINEMSNFAHQKAVIFLNGEIRNKKYYNKLIQDKSIDLLIAADGGAKIFLELGTYPDFVIGDLDSLGKQEVEKLKTEESEMISYPQDKDETDAELCLQFCHDHSIKKAILTCSLGGRIDQQLANIFLLEYGINLGMDCKIVEPNLEIGLIESKKIFSNKIGWFLSLLPLNYEIEEVSIKGCKYEVSNLNMKRFLTRGISNKISASEAEISVGEGKLIYILRKGE